MPEITQGRILHATLTAAEFYIGTITLNEVTYGTLSLKESNE
jgi:hypothetical protein